MAEELTAQDLTVSLTELLAEKLANSLWELLKTVAIAAQEKGWHLYLVGGGVRDLLLAENETELLLQDVDLVVDGGDTEVAVGAGVELANVIQELYPKVKVAVHGEFQTAAIAWQDDPVLGSLSMDIATARTEIYPHPAANPEVKASSIREDLYRRDFTVNALCLRLTKPQAGHLLDFFDGLTDLKNKELRILHADSFIEDPTRIYRGVRFATRLDFTLETQTEECLRGAIASGLYPQLHQEKPEAPALATRLKSELKYLFTTNYWKSAIKLLNDWGALQCIRQDLVLTKELWWSVRYVDRWLRCHDPEKKLEHWRLLLESLLLGLTVDVRLEVGDRLKLPKDSLQRLANIYTYQNELLPILKNAEKISEKVFALKKMQLAEVILLAAIAPKSVRRDLWQYLQEWQYIKAPLNGSDLKKLGFQPGPQFKIILQDLLAKKLDREVCDHSSAIIYLQETYCT